ncbi:LysR family transcriptional regulator [Tabrizicola flagellatus]|uniref:LysR family transcriptional regulator n=1 Tax=Tabrizicola flagellatus TaxID=2593021 RepID=UPI0011F10C3C|nr:LysR family transcriptional regulator [Tabrizicola flagellatus]
MHDVDTQLLRTFVSLAETRSFSRTAGRVGRSQSAVSGQLARLEAALGVRLLARDTRNVALTPEGERLLPDARAMVAQADAMLARFRAPDLAGLVRFGSPEDFASFYLPEILGVFAAAHPAVELHVTCQLTLPLIAEFEAGEQDLIVVKQDPGRPYPGSRALWRERLVWVSSPGFDAGLRPVPLVLSPAPCVYRARATGALEAAGLAWLGVYTSPSFAGAVAAVRAGLGATVMPQAMVPPGLVVQDGFPPLAEAEIALLTRPRAPAAVQALASFVAEKVRR